MLAYFLVIASGLTASTYGHGEFNCGEPGNAVPCSRGATTASGEQFKPHAVASAAIAMPANMRMRATWVWLRLTTTTECKRVRLNDKMHARYVKKRGFDLSPAAQRLLTGVKAVSHWTDRVAVCGYENSSGAITIVDGGTVLGEQLGR